MAGLRPASRGHGARDDLGQRLCQLDGVGVLQGEDVNLALAALVGTSSRLMNSRIRRYARSVAMTMIELLRSSARSS